MYINDSVLADKLKWAREYRNLTVTDLAEQINIKKQTVSAYETGKIKPSEKILLKISDILNFPVQFFFNNQFQTNPPQLLSFRKKASTSKNQIKSVYRISELLSGIVDFVEGFVDLPSSNLPVFDIPNIESLEDEQIENFAGITRECLGLSTTPIQNLTHVLEENGVIISFVDTDSKIDGFSCFKNGRPIIILSKENKTAVRQRFSLAHELAHIILHKNCSSEEIFSNDKLHKIIERQADIFASAFLMPSDSFINDVISPHIYILERIKKKWGVSIQAMISRLFHLNVISKNQRVYLIIQIKDRKSEVYDDEIKAERPNLLNNAFKTLLENGISKEFISDTLCLNIDEIIHITSIQPKLFIDKEEIMAVFKLKNTSLLQKNWNI